MPEVDLLNSKGENVGKINLPEEIFGKKLNRGLVHEALVSQLAIARQGTASTKTKAEVSGGGLNPGGKRAQGEHGREVFVPLCGGMEGLFLAPSPVHTG